MRIIKDNERSACVGEWTLALRWERAAYTHANNNLSGDHNCAHMPATELSVGATPLSAWSRACVHKSCIQYMCVSGVSISICWPGFCIWQTFLFLQKSEIILLLITFLNDLLSKWLLILIILGSMHSKTVCIQKLSSAGCQCAAMQLLRVKSVF